VQPRQQVADFGWFGGIVIEGEHVLLGQVNDTVRTQPDLEILGQLQGAVLVRGHQQGRLIRALAPGGQQRGGRTAKKTGQEQGPVLLLATGGFHRRGGLQEPVAGGTRQH